VKTPKVAHPLEPLFSTSSSKSAALRVPHLKTLVTGKKEIQWTYIGKDWSCSKTFKI
jgi:hypothetical protein